MDQPLSPAAQAADARAKAGRLDGEARAYWLWLAGEWDKTAAREVQPPREAFRRTADLHH